MDASIERYLGFVALLDHLRDVHADGELSYYGSRTRSTEDMSRRVEFRKPEDWFRNAMVCPAPKYTFGQFMQNAKCRRSGQPKKYFPNPQLMPDRVYVADFDESKGHGRTRAEILDLVRASDVEPLCMVPTKTEGNFQVWFLLNEPWSGPELKPPPEWEADDKAHYRSLCWNPLFRTFVPQDVDAPSMIHRTWWNPDLDHGIVPMVDAALMVRALLPPLTSEPVEDVPDPVLEPLEREAVKVRTTGEHLPTAVLWDNLRTAREGTPNGRNNAIFALSRRLVGAGHLAGAKGRKLTLDEVRFLTIFLNCHTSDPLDLDECAELAYGRFSRDESGMQRSRVLKRVTPVLWGDVYAALDGLIALRLTHGLDPKLDARGFHYRWREVTNHPDQEHFLTTPWSRRKGTYAHLAHLDPALTEAKLKKWVERYADAYQTRWMTGTLDPYLETCASAALPPSTANQTSLDTLMALKLIEETWGTENPPRLVYPQSNE